MFLLTSDEIDKSVYYGIIKKESLIRAFMDVFYVPVNDLTPLKGVDELVVALKSFKRVALTSTIQFKHRITELREAIGRDVIVCDTVLGCRALIPDVDCIVLIATGVFHAIKVALTTNKPVFIVSPEGFSKLDKGLIDDFKKKQSIRVSKVMDAKVIGVLVSTKLGQSNERLGERVVKVLQSKGRDACLFVANELSPSQLNDYPVDAWVNTACPRIVEDEFEKPIVNWGELKNHLDE